MNNKGFTLVELLGTLIIITLMTVLIVPKILEWFNNSTDTYRELNEELIVESARLYVDDRPNEFKKQNGKVYCIQMQTLIDSGYLEEKNVQGFDRISYEDEKVTVMSTDEAYDFYLDKDCTPK